MLVCNGNRSATTYVEPPRLDPYTTNRAPCETPAFGSPSGMLLAEFWMRLMVGFCASAIAAAQRERERMRNGFMDCCSPKVKDAKRLHGLPRRENKPSDCIAPPQRPAA